MNSNTYYIVDLSYIIFFSGFSAFNNYKRNFDIRNVDLRPEFDPTLDEEFCALFYDSLIYNIKKPIQRINPFANISNIIFCTDCSRKNIWRREIYPDYKINRDLKDTTKDEFNFGKVFNYAKNIAIPGICDDFNCIKVSCDCAEGDDIIGILTNKLLLDDNNKIIIISSDRDMIQLYQDRVTIVTVMGEIREPVIDINKLTKSNLTKFSAADFLLFKILIGDGADNIPNIKNGIGPKKALNLVNNKEQLKKLLLEDTIIRDSFIRNKKLISMNEIPNDVKNLILENYEYELNKRNSK